MLSTSSVANAQPWRQSKLGAMLTLRFARSLLTLLFFASPVWAQQAPSTDECVAHMELAKELLRSEKPSAALRELDLAFAVRQEPRVLYLQGLAQDKLGNAQESVLLFSRFLAAAPGECCADERAYASRRIVKLRRLMELAAVAREPATSAPPRSVAQVLDDNDKTGRPTPAQQQTLDGKPRGLGLMITGSVMFGASYLLPPVLIGALGADRRYFLPVAGPLWIAGDQFTTKCDPNKGLCAFGDALAGLMVVNSIVQATGLLLLISGGVVWGTATKPAAAVAFYPRPMPGGWGLGIAGAY